MIWGTARWGWGARPGLAGWPSSCISPQARCFGLPVSPELRSVTLAAAMKCFLLALGLALACGIQAAYIPQMAGDLDIRKVWGLGWRVGARGWGPGLRGDRKAWTAEV